MTPIKKRKLLKLDNIQFDKCVQIQGTQYDRKRKFIDAEVAEMKAKLRVGWSLRQVAQFYGTTVFTVKRNTDETFAEATRKYYRDRKVPHTGIDHVTMQDRIEYKKELLKKHLTRKDLVIKENV